nr:hypothetical protein [Pseudomonas juntendi]
MLDQLKPFDELIASAEKQLEHLSLLELFSYLSVLAYEAFAEDVPADRSGQQWKVYNRIILNKLRACSEDDFRLSESRLGQSLKRHLSPIIFPGSSNSDVVKCRQNLESLALLIGATQERIDYEDFIDWFCFDPECRYQLEPGVEGAANTVVGWTLMLCKEGFGISSQFRTVQPKISSRSTSCSSPIERSSVFSM